MFSLPTGTKMFHFPAFPPHTLYIQVRVTRHQSSWVSPFGHPRINARLTTPRGLSRPPTSFIGSWCPGIHHVPLPTYTHKDTEKAKKLDARIHYTVLKQQPHRQHPPNQAACSLRTQQCTTVPGKTTFDVPQLSAPQVSTTHGHSTPAAPPPTHSMSRRYRCSLERR